jgi:hypothetical protein
VKKQQLYQWRIQNLGLTETQYWTSNNRTTVARIILLLFLLLLIRCYVESKIFIFYSSSFRCPVAHC